MQITDCIFVCVQNVHFIFLIQNLNLQKKQVSYQEVAPIKNLHNTPSKACKWIV